MEERIDYGKWSDYFLQQMIVLILLERILKLFRKKCYSLWDGLDPRMNVGIENHKSGNVMEMYLPELMKR